MSRSTSASGLSSELTPSFSKQRLPQLDLLTALPESNKSGDLVASPLLTPIEQSMQVRSYLRFRFTSPDSKALFLIPPRTTLKDKVKVVSRGVGEGEEAWQETQIEERCDEKEGKCVEVEIVSPSLVGHVEMEFRDATLREQ